MQTLPAGVALMQGDASLVKLPDESEDIVLQSTVFSSLLDDAVPAAPGAGDVALGAPGRRRAVVRLHRRQSAQPGRARRAGARACASCSRDGRVQHAARHAGAADRTRGVPRASRRCTRCSMRCRCCARTCWPGSKSRNHEQARSCRLPCPRSAKKRSPRSSTRCAPAGSPPARRPSASRTTSPPSSATRRCSASPSTRPPPGLHLALEALGIGPGDEVITTTHTFTATAEVVRYLGADVKLVDIDPATLNIDPRGRRRRSRRGPRPSSRCTTAAWRPTCRRILDIARRHRPEGGRRRRACAAHHQRRALVGTLASDATVFSFYANKTITTGEGGMLVTRDAELAQRARVMRLHGMSRDAFDRFTADGAELVLRDRGAGLQVQPDRHRRGDRPAPAQEGARVPAAARADRGALSDAAFAGLPLICRARRAGGRDCMPGTCTRCAWPTTPASRATRSSSACSSAASAAACTTSRCTCTPTGAIATASPRRCSRTASAPTSAC